MARPDYLDKKDGNPFLGQERASMHTLSMGVPCAPPPLGCGVGIGEPCINTLTGRPLSWRFPAHPTRLRIAQEGHHYLERPA